MIWAMILAAGESRRMGEAKLLLPFRGKTIIETIIENVIRSKVDKILVVLGSDKEKIEEKIKNFPLEFAFNPDYRSGMLSSIQAGFKALPEDAQAVLIILGDQPSVSSKVINKIIAAYKKTGKGIVLPVYKKERGHPVLIDTKYRQEVAKLSPKIGLRKLVYNRPDDILEVKVETSSVLRDIDDAEDYRKELEKSREK
jgi:molybdenum cofactor cytidylyltransferase